MQVLGVETLHIRATQCTGDRWNAKRQLPRYVEYAKGLSSSGTW